jgi:hypothetical protein
MTIWIDEKTGIGAEVHHCERHSLDANDLVYGRAKRLARKATWERSQKAPKLEDE